MNILGTSQNDIDHDFYFFSSMNMTWLLLFNGYVTFFLKKKEKRKNILKKRKIKTYSVWSLFFFFKNLISQTGGVLFEDNQEAEAGAEGEEEVVVVATIEAILILGRT